MTIEPPKLPDMSKTLQEVKDAMQEVGAAAEASMQDAVRIMKQVSAEPRMRGAIAAYEDWRGVLWTDDEKKERHE